jgi:hypothetical protein
MDSVPLEYHRRCIREKVCTAATAWTTYGEFSERFEAVEDDDRALHRSV